MGGIPSGPLLDIRDRLEIKLNTSISVNFNLLHENIEFIILLFKLLFRKIV